MNKLIRSTFIVSLCIFISKICGYVKDIIIAAKLGAGLLNDIYIISFKIVNMVKSIFTEGALHLVFIPEFSEKIKNHGKSKALLFASKMHIALIILLTIVCLASVMIMPYIVWHSTPGFRNNIRIYNLSILLGKIIFPYLFFISLVSFYGGILNSFGKFFPFAIAPAIINIAIIILLIIVDIFATSAHSVSIATSVGGAIELSWMAFFLFSNKYKLKITQINVNRKNIRIIKNTFSIIISSGITYMNIWFNITILSLFPGGLSYLYYADRIIQFPLAIIGTSIGTVALPMLVKNINHKNDKKYLDYLQNNSINLVMMFTIPATIALFYLSKNIVYILFEKGEFKDIDTISTSKNLKILIFGLPAFIFVKLFQTKFYAKFNTKIPVIISFICTFINIIINIILINKVQYLCVAFANIVSGWVNITILIIFAYKILHFKFQKFILLEIVKYSFASIIMIFCMQTYTSIIDWRNNFLSLLIEIIIGFISYAITCYFIKIKIFY